MIDRVDLAVEILLKVVGASGSLGRSASDLVSFSFEIADEFIKTAQEDLDLRGEAY